MTLVSNISKHVKFCSEFQHFFVFLVGLSPGLDYKYAQKAYQIQEWPTATSRFLSIRREAAVYSPVRSKDRTWFRRWPSPKVSCSLSIFNNRLLSYANKLARWKHYKTDSRIAPEGSKESCQYSKHDRSVDDVRICKLSSSVLKNWTGRGNGRGLTHRKC